MFKLYTTLTQIWHNNVAIPAGEIVAFTDEQVKYLRHAVEEVKDRAVGTLERIEKTAVDRSGDNKTARPAGPSTVEAPKEKL